MSKDRKEVAEQRGRLLSPGEQYRSGLVYRLATVDTTAALERQLGAAVVDEERRLELADAQRVAEMSNRYAAGALQAVMDAPTFNPTPEVATNQPIAPEGPAFQPLPGFTAEAPMPQIDQNQSGVAA